MQFHLSFICINVFFLWPPLFLGLILSNLYLVSGFLSVTVDLYPAIVCWVFNTRWQHIFLYYRFLASQKEIKSLLFVVIRFNLPLHILPQYHFMSFHFSWCYLVCLFPISILKENIRVNYYSSIEDYFFIYFFKQGELILLVIIWIN